MEGPLSLSLWFFTQQVMIKSPGGSYLYFLEGFLENEAVHRILTCGIKIKAFIGFLTCGSWRKASALGKSALSLSHCHVACFPWIAPRFTAQIALLLLLLLPWLSRTLFYPCSALWPWPSPCLSHGYGPTTHESPCHQVVKPCISTTTSTSTISNFCKTPQPWCQLWKIIHTHTQFHLSLWLKIHSLVIAWESVLKGR